MADKNLDQLQRTGTVEANDLLHLRRNGLDYSVSSEDFAASLATPADTLLGISNVGTGGGIIHKTTASNIAQLRRISGSGNVTVTTASDNIVVSVSGDNTKVDKVDTAIVGNFASFTADGGIEDSSYSQANFATTAQGDLADTALQDIANESIGDLVDVNLTGIAAGDTLVWDDANSEFVPGTASGTLNGLSNVGGGTGIYKDATGGVANLKTLVAGSGVVFTAGADTIQIDATGTGDGEANTGVNLGTGEVVFAQKSGVNLEFKTLVAGANTTITSTGSEITIASSGSGGGDVVSVNGEVGVVVLDATDVGAQPADATLTALAGVTTAADEITYFTGVDTAASTPLTSFGRSLIDDSDSAEARATLETEKFAHIAKSQNLGSVSGTVTIDVEAGSVAYMSCSTNIDLAFNWGSISGSGRVGTCTLHIIVSGGASITLPVGTKRNNGANPAISDGEVVLVFEYDGTNLWVYQLGEAMS